MSGFDIKPSGGSSLATYDRVAVIAGRGPRESISEVLEREEIGFEVFDDVEALLAAGDWSAQHSPSVIVLCLEDSTSRLLPDIGQVTQSFTKAAVIVLRPSIERWGIRAALAAGAAGVVLWEDLDAALEPCIRAVSTGQTCVPREHWRQIDPPALSTREKQILGLVVMGYMNGQIAQQLFLAESTVKSHLSSAFGKLGVRSRNEAVRLILDPERGLGTGILGLGGEPLESESYTPSASFQDFGGTKQAGHCKPEAS